MSATRSENPTLITALAPLRFTGRLNPLKGLLFTACECGFHRDLYQLLWFLFTAPQGGNRLIQRRRQERERERGILPFYIFTVNELRDSDQCPIALARKIKESNICSVHIVSVSPRAAICCSALKCVGLDFRNTAFQHTIISFVFIFIF